jgi:2,6-dihydroxypseudooxynicotine hydrolase
MPEVSQQVFQARCHANSRIEAEQVAKLMTLEGKAHNIQCPLLIVFGGGDRIVPPSEGRRLADAVGDSADFVVYEDGNHVCFNISYKFRPLTADWMAEALGVPLD